MSVEIETLGGRLPLLDPQALSAQQKEIYDRLNTTWVAWADSVPFRARLRTEDLSVRSIQYSSAPPFHQASWIFRKLNKTIRH
jgi:hypothetical protein